MVFDFTAEFNQTQYTELTAQLNNLTLAVMDTGADVNFIRLMVIMIFFALMFIAVDYMWHIGRWKDW